MSRYDRSSRRASASRKRPSRKANSAVPGYDNLGWDHFGHPASSDQPSADEYGFDSEFGEGVHEGPYRSGPAPASVAWTPEHPASSDVTKEDYAMTHDLRQENLKQAMERKAQKCIRIAEVRLGKRASRQQVEDLALRMMDLPNRTINARVARLADDEVMSGMYADDMYADDEIIDDIGLMADQNDPEHFAEDNMASHHMSHTMRDVYDTNGDGMISREEWGGSDSVFDAMDMNDDGFLDADELGMGVGESIAGMTLAEELAEELATLKMANARLARKVRKLAEDAEAKEDSAKEDSAKEDSAKEESAKEESAKEDSAKEDSAKEESAKEESAKEASTRLAKIERLANALSAYMAEAEESSETEASAEMSDMASLLAELETEASEEVSEDVMGLDAPSMASIDPRLASIFTASEEEDEEEGEEEEGEEEAPSKKAKKSEEIQMSEEEEEEEEEEEAPSKKASYKPRRSTRQASVKTLGNISREASSSDELSKLWESAPDVSKFFN